MTTKHTPGPWRVVTDGINYWVEVNNRIIIVSKGRSKAEAEQHAHLIAAAPEMLEALVNLMDCYRDCFGLPDIDRTEDIISKAKGQTYQDHQDKQGEV